MTQFYTNVSRLGNDILYRGYSDGKQITKKFKYKPTLFIDSKEESTEWTAMNGGPVDDVVFDSMSEATKFVDRYKDVSGFNIHGNTNYVAQFIQDVFPGTINYNIPDIRILYFDIEVDITDGYAVTKEADKPVTSVAMKFSGEDEVHILGISKYGKYDPAKTELDLDKVRIVYHECKDEIELLFKFVSLWSRVYPDVITGWNCKFFDVPYIVKRISNIIGVEQAKKLSPWGRVNFREVDTTYGKQPTYDIVGVSTLDYMDVFKKFGFKYLPQETFKLDHIAHVVLGERKLDYQEYGDLNGLLARNYQKYIDYNIKDTLLIERMEDKTALLALAFDMAYRGGVNYIDTMGTTGIWDTILYRYQHDRKIAVPMAKFDPTDFTLAGGYVKQPKPGMYKNICSFDLDSLYPHIMWQYNMSPETYRPQARIQLDQYKVLNGEFKNESDKYAYAANGAAFDKTKKGMVPSIVGAYYAERKAVKQKMLAVESDIEVIKEKMEKQSSVELEQLLAKKEKEATILHNNQMAIKILINSLYGATGNRYFRYFVSAIAEAITTSGQLSTMWAERALNRYFNKLFDTDEVDYVTYCDTDSVYVNMDPLVKRVLGDEYTRDQLETFLDKVCAERIDAKVIKGCYADLAETMGAFENKMNMSREVIAETAVFVAKKKYFMSVLNSEGVHYPTPQIKVRGIESVRSSTPAICREKLKESFGLIAKGDEKGLQKFISNFEEEFRKLPVEEIAKPTGVNGIEEKMDPKTLYKSGTPFHVRGAIVYNQALKDKGVFNKYESIKSGDKVKVIYLKEPNPVRENALAFATVLPEELGVHPYIDYKTQFQKTFVNPIENIVKVLGWEVEEKSTLDMFFA